jgi:hypothetical protein
MVFSFGGYFFARLYAGHIGVVMTQAWLPMILWGTHNAVARDRWPWAVLAGVPVALSLLGGHTASFYYVALIQVAYALYLAWERWREEGRSDVFLRGLLWPGVSVLVGVGLACAQLVPTLEFLRLSTRQEASYAFATSYSWSPGYLLTLLVPNFFGDPVRTGYWGDGVYEELIFYTGILPLFLSLTLGTRLRHRRAPFLLGLAGVGLLMALGPFAIVHRLAYHFLPLFRAARAPARAGFLFAFAVAALSGLTISWLRRNPEEALPKLHRLVEGSLPRQTLLVAIVVVLGGFSLFALQRNSNPEIGRIWHVANSTALFLFFFLLTVGLLGGWGRRIRSPWSVLLAMGLVLVDLWSFGRPLIQPAQVVESPYWRGVAQITSAEGRVLPWGLGIFEHNHGMDFGVESIFGYDPLELERYHRLTTLVPDPRSRAYDLLHAQYLVTGQEMELPEGETALQLVGQQDGAWVYERMTALPRAWLVHRVETEGTDEGLLARLNEADFDPRQTVLLADDPPCEVVETAEVEGVRLVDRGNNRIEVEVEAAATGVLVFSEVYYPGWRATVDGEPAALLRADYTLRGVCVPAGTHRVTLRFVPASLQIGAGISLISLLLVGWAAWRGRRQSEAPPISPRQ